MFLFCVFERGSHTCRKHALFFFFRQIRSQLTWHRNKSIFPHHNRELSGHFSVYQSQHKAWPHSHIDNQPINHICSGWEHSPYEAVHRFPVTVLLFGTHSGFYPISQSHVCQWGDLEMRLPRYHRSCLAKGRQKVKGWIRLMSCSGFKTGFVFCPLRSKNTNR